MANGVVERGELYWVKLGNSVGSEESVGRPGVIVSSKKGNDTSPVVQIAYTTSQVKYGVINPSTYASGRKTWILCNQIQTVDKSRLERYIGKLSSEEMREVDSALEAVFDLGYKDDDMLAEKDKEIEKLKAEIVELTGQVAREQALMIEQKAKHDEELLSYKLENTMWQKSYERTMDMLVRTTVDGAFASRIVKETPKPVVPVAPENPPVDNPPVENLPVESAPVADERVDINHCTQTELKKVGFSASLARAVVAARPFENVEGLKKVQGMNRKKYQIVEPKVCCTPLQIIVLESEESVEEKPPVKVTLDDKSTFVKKINLNAVKAKELHERTGVALSTCYCITGHRTKNGPYEKLEDLTGVKQVSDNVLNTLRNLVEFGPMPEVPKKDEGAGSESGDEKDLSLVPGEKVNVNKVTSIAELQKKTGMCQRTASEIIRHREQFGDYERVEDLLNLKHFGVIALNRYGHMLEV